MDRFHRIDATLGLAEPKAPVEVGVHHDARYNEPVWIVTGASGFVGSHVLRELREAHDAAGLFRGAATDATARRVTDWTVSELTKALAGATGVVHAASVVHRPSTPPEEYVRFNVEGTRALVDAARAANVTRFVFLSSIKVHGEHVSAIDEHTPIAPESDYAETKARAERIVLDATDLRPVVLRLCPVYGRGDKGNVRTMIRAIHRRRFVIPGDGSTRKSIVHATTVAKVARAVVADGGEGAFVVSDRQTPSIRELADVIASALGRRRPPSLPKPLVRTVAEVVGRVARRAGISTAISGALIGKSTTSSVCDPSAIAHTLGVDPHVDLEWAIADEVDWLLADGLL